MALNLVFVGEDLETSAGHEEFLSLRGHAVGSEQIAEDLEVAGLVGTRILRYLFEIGEGAPLALFVGDEWSRVFGVVRCRFEVTWQTDSIAVIIVATGLTAVPFQAAGAAFDMVLRAVVPFPSAADAGRAVDARGVVGFHLPNEVDAPFHPSPCGLVASCQHDEGRVMAIAVEDGTTLVREVAVDGHAVAELHAVVGPRRPLGLKVETEAIGSHEGGFRRTIAVEAHVVQAVVLAFADDTLPRGGVGGREARLGETAVLDGAAQVDTLAVQEYVATADGHLAEAEGDTYGLSFEGEDGGVELGVMFAPRLGIGDVDVEGLFVEGDVCGLGGKVGGDALAID